MRAMSRQRASVPLLISLAGLLRLSVARISEGSDVDAKFDADQPSRIRAD